MTSSPVTRVALVTGANRGLGRALARQLAGQGLHVVGTARTHDVAERTAAELRAEGLAVSGQALDVTDPASVFRAFADTVHEYGRLDVLVNNSGVAIDRNKTITEADLELVKATLDTNVLGVWRCCAQAVPVMRENGYGRILNVTSHMGSLAGMGSNSPAYRISKAALNALTLALAAEVADTNILINAASPGLADTRLAYGTATQSPQDAARDMLWLALLPDDGPRGGLFHGTQPLAP
ncbi:MULTISPECIES: SDR family NAD(P)-dependent oxidoreductase [unclassified Streptomyces]|uniref:SDR family NAD(P)-dependent oxidoreductase n=1 Tax=unclassified Streptomyces TaxID=2593676 RepID=UPI00081D5E3D|nr:MULTISPECIES: SDR family NAD(P)-dependent oxidoreductase [unclassified Streptomyces]MYZ37913.1 SDR family NAD(P)-dependent oxidoreductase [Streptomyces sp. SID4917]SCF95109.1 NADP-dependent 3-hydroxy acid dehydrogenase YdfG [Streptomyces sp. MnatMP-M17]